MYSIVPHGFLYKQKSRKMLEKYNELKCKKQKKNDRYRNKAINEKQIRLQCCFPLVVYNCVFRCT